jgi:hypothetical protein
MRHNLAPEFPRRRATPPMAPPNTALVMILALLTLIGMVIALVAWPF